MPAPSGWTAIPNVGAQVHLPGGKGRGREEREGSPLKKLGKGSPWGYEGLLEDSVPHKGRRVNEKFHRGLCPMNTRISNAWGAGEDLWGI